MKRTIIATFAIALAACSQQTSTSVEASSEVAKDGASVSAPVRAVYDGFAVGDIGTVTAQMSADIVWNEAETIRYADGNPYIGPDAVVAGVFGRLGGEWTGFAATPAEFIEDGNRVAVLGRYTATNNATGKPINAQFVHVWTVEGGKITRFQQYTDTAQFTNAMAE